MLRGPMDSNDSWIERQILRFFMKRSLFAAAVVPFLLGVVILYGIGIVAALIAEHRVWTTSVELSSVEAGGVFALAITYLVTILATSALSTRGRYSRLLALHQTMRAIRAMSWREFEQLLAAHYTAVGYEVEHVGRAGPDGGRDLVMKKDGKTVLVQCKHYRDSWVSEVPLRQFLGTLENFRADRGIFVSCGVFDQSAEAFAANNERIELVAGEQLEEMIQAAVAHQLSGRTYACRICGAPMKPKAGRYGRFLSCSNYPACKGSQDWPVRLPSAM